MPIFPPGFIPFGYFNTRTEAVINTIGEWQPLNYTEIMWEDQYEYFEKPTNIDVIYEGKYNYTTTISKKIIDDTILLITGNNVVVDESKYHFPLIIEGSQNNLPSIDTVTKRYGKGSTRFNSNFNQLVAYTQNSWNVLGSNNFTVEFDFFPRNNVSCGLMGDDLRSFNIILKNRQLSFKFGTHTWLSPFHAPVNQWTKLAFQRKDNFIQIFINGGMVHEIDVEDFSFNAGKICFGCDIFHSAGAHYFNGNIDNIRIVKGTAIYPETGFVLSDVDPNTILKALPKGNFLTRVFYDRVNYEYFNYPISPNFLLAYGIEAPGTPIRQDTEFFDYESNTVSLMNNSNYDRYFATMFADMRGYIYGIFGENSYNDGIEVYDQESNVWRSGIDYEMVCWKSCPTTSYNHDFALIGPGFLNIAGGGDVKERKSFGFDFNVWEQQTDFIGEGFIQHVCASDNLYQHIFGGAKNLNSDYGAGDIYSNVMVDFQNYFTQTLKVNLPLHHFGAGGIGSVIARYQSIFIGMGIGENSTTFGFDKTDTYNSNSDTWTSCIDIPGLGWGLGTSNKIKDGVVLVRPGADFLHNPPFDEDDSIIRSESYEYSLLSNSYTQKQDFIIARMGHSSANF